MSSKSKKRDKQLRKQVMLQDVKPWIMYLKTEVKNKLSRYPGGIRQGVTYGDYIKLINTELKATVNNCSDSQPTHPKLHLLEPEIQNLQSRTSTFKKLKTEPKNIDSLTRDPDQQHIVDREDAYDGQSPDSQTGYKHKLKHNGTGRNQTVRESDQDMK
jgi:hypothetical protein